MTPFFSHAIYSSQCHISQPMPLALPSKYTRTSSIFPSLHGFYSDPRDCHHLLPTFCFLSSRLFSLHPTQQLDQSDHMIDCLAHYPPMAPPSHFTKPKQSNPIYYFPFCYSSSGLFPICGAHQACPHVRVSYHSFSQEHSSHTGLFPNVLQVIT